MWWILAWACDGAPASDSGLDLPGHSACLPEGEVMPRETCVAVVEEDGRLPTTSWRASNAVPPDEDDPRLTDPDYQWLTSEIERCTCVCCHRSSTDGPGAFKYDLDFGPVWIDSANDWTLKVLLGDTGDALRTLPSTDAERLRSVVEREWALRQSPYLGN